MPKSDATLNLGTDKLYRTIPGLRNMRGVYRWLLVVKLFAVVGAATLLSSMLAQPSRTLRWLTAVILVVAFVDLAGPLPRLHHEYRSFRKMITKFDSEVIDPLQRYVNPGDKVAFLSKENDYLANYIAGKLALLTFNIGGDKNIIMSRAVWPREFQMMRRGIDVIENVHRLLLNHKVRWLVIPHFSLRWHSYAWPPAREQVTQRAARVEAFRQANDFLVIEEDFFSLVGLHR